MSKHNRERNRLWQNGIHKTQVGCKLSPLQIQAIKEERKEKQKTLNEKRLVK